MSHEGTVRRGVGRREEERAVRDETRQGGAAVHGKLIRVLVSGVLMALLMGVASGPLGAQYLQTQELGRAYWHVFAAYAIAWLLVLGWVVSVARRLARVEDRLRG
jgi:CcmD family protein